MPQTISVQFDPKSLPRWARKNEDVIARCESDLAFRCEVFSATTNQMRRQLERDAELWAVHHSNTAHMEAEIDPLADAYDPDDEADFVHLKGALGHGHIS